MASESEQHPGISSLKAFGFGLGLTIINQLVPTLFNGLWVLDALIYGATGLVALKILSNMGGRKQYAFKPSGMTLFQVVS
jgi:hypothetical protein